MADCCPSALSVKAHLTFSQKPGPKSSFLCSAVIRKDLRCYTLSSNVSRCVVALLSFISNLSQVSNKALCTGAKFTPRIRLGATLHLFSLVDASIQSCLLGASALLSLSVGK